MNNDFKYYKENAKRKKFSNSYEILSLSDVIITITHLQAKNG